MLANARKSQKKLGNVSKCWKMLANARQCKRQKMLANAR